MKNVLLSLLVFVFAQTAQTQPVDLHPENNHYLLFRGKPLVIVSSGEHYGAVINPDFDYHRYLDALKADGMNYTRIFSGTYFEKAGSFGILKNTLAPKPGMALVPWARSNEPGNKSGGNRFDLTKFDDNYFARLKSFIKAASERDIIVEVTLFSSIYGYWDIQPFNPSNNVNIESDLTKEQVHTISNTSVWDYQEKFVRKIVKELNNFDNIFFEIQNEPWSDHPEWAAQKSEYYSRQDFAQEGAEWRNKVELADSKSLEWQKKIAEVIVSEEKALGRKHLIAQNYCNFYFPVLEVDPNVSIMNFHYNYPVVVEQNYARNRVVGFDESGFAGKLDVTYRRQAWNFIIAGGGLFNNLDYSFACGEENGTAVNEAPGGGSPQLRRQLKVLSDFIHSFKFIKMKPDNVTLTQSPGAFVRILSEPGKQYAIYVSSGNSCELTLSIPAGKYIAEWISTSDGSVLKTEYFTSENGSVKLEAPLYSEDIALRILKTKKK
jgi:hypothetical protein